MADSPYLIVGLGNPGPQYADTRHNLGFRVIEALARRWPDVRFTQKFHAQTCQTTYGPHKVILMMPQTFMNRSGLSVGEAASFFKINIETNLFVVYDDLDTPPATLRIRMAGGAGGNNGMKSIIESVGSEKFPRLRIGIGRPPGGPTDGYVLARIPSAQREAFDKTFASAMEAIETFIGNGIMAAMNKFNSRRESDES